MLGLVYTLFLLASSASLLKAPAVAQTPSSSSSTTASTTSASALAPSAALLLPLAPVSTPLADRPHPRRPPPMPLRGAVVRTRASAFLQASLYRSASLYRHIAEEAKAAVDIARSRSLRRRLRAEALGTAIIVLGSNLAAHLFLAASLSAALLTGASVTGAVYLFRGVSGAHFNPAVTLAFAAQGTTRSREVVPYVLAQGSGALFGSSLALLSGPMVSRALTSAAKPAAFMAAPALHAEALATSLLIIAIFQIGDQVDTGQLSYAAAPALVGVCIAALVVSFGHLGIGLNPAIAAGGRLGTLLVSAAGLLPGGGLSGSTGALAALGVLRGAVASTAGPLLGALLGLSVHKRCARRDALPPVREEALVVAPAPVVVV